MLNTSILPAPQGEETKVGVFLLKDSWNVRYQLSGGGTTCALKDVAILREPLLDVKDLTDREQVVLELSR